MADRRKPEQSIAYPHMVTSMDVECDVRFTRADVGHWVVMGSGGIVRCKNYRHAQDVASSFNRCPA